MNRKSTKPSFAAMFLLTKPVREIGTIIPPCRNCDHISCAMQREKKRQKNQMTCIAGAIKGKPVGDAPITFRVYPENRFLYAQVNIWPSKAAMYRHKPLDRNHEASCTGEQRIVIPQKGKGRIRKRGVFAELNLHRKSLGMEVVTHEFSHAAFCWAERRNLDLGLACGPDSSQIKNATLTLDSVEERFCYALGQMCRQFTQKCYDLGLY